MSKQLSAELTNEGVATINAVAGAEAILGESLIAPDNAYVIHHYVDASVIPNAPSVDATSAFQSVYQTFLNSPGMGTLGQGANAIGKFYGPNEVVGFNTSETYDQYYTSHNQSLFDGYHINAEAAASSAAVEAAYRKVEALRMQIVQNPYLSHARYNQANQAYQNLKQRDQVLQNEVKAMNASQDH